MRFSIDSPFGLFPSTVLMYHKWVERFNFSLSASVSYRGFTFIVPDLEDGFNTNENDLL